jgi:murein DD-endopeptidase MepM/ murein hydrolase activator NlpD
MLRFLILGLLVVPLLCSCSTVRPARSEHVGLFGAKNQNRSQSAEETLLAAKKLELHWPLKSVRVTSKFGKRPRDFHEGIDLKAKSGTPVYAAQDGKVLYAGIKIRGYGNMIVIKHRYGIATVYAHNSRLLVRTGDWVSLGQQIAVSGSTGRSTGPHLHFEVRYGVSAVDPVQMVRLAQVGGVERAVSRPSRRLASIH